MSWSFYTYSIWNCFSIGVLIVDGYWGYWILIEIDLKISEQKCLHISNEVQKTHIELKTCCVWVRMFRVLKRRHVLENLGKVISCNFHHIISINIHQHPSTSINIHQHPSTSINIPIPLKLISFHPHLITTRTWKESIHLHRCPALAMSLASETLFSHLSTILAIPSHNPMLQTLPGCIVPINAVQCCYQQSNCRRCLRFQPL